MYPDHPPVQAIQIRFAVVALILPLAWWMKQSLDLQLSLGI